jgi:D-beta-D-heptose 7-phosphate kinase/D-beta-D-heptose 1-phosphate adenosyltransferase
VRARDKLLTRPAAISQVRAAQRKGQEVVFTNGCFDLLHVGHVRRLEQARSLGDRLVVALNSDASVRALKGPGRPIMPLRQRMEVVAGLACVDWVLLFRDATPLSTIRALKPDILAKGGEWSLDQVVCREDVERWGGRVVQLREVPGIRSTWLIERAGDSS